MVHRKRVIVTWLAVQLVGFSAAAHAYLDPGTGSILVQSLLAGIAGCGCDREPVLAAAKELLHEHAQDNRTTPAPVQRPLTTTLPDAARRRRPDAARVRAEPGSFRDPGGRIYWLGDRVLRTVMPSAAADFEFVESTARRRFARRKRHGDRPGAAARVAARRSGRGRGVRARASPPRFHLLSV